MKKPVEIAGVALLILGFSACGKSDDGGDGDGDGDGSGGMTGDGDGDGSGGMNGDGDTAGGTGGGDGDGAGGMGGGDGDASGGMGGTIEPECTEASECDDDDECTEEACENEACVYTSVDGAFCADAGNECVTDSLANFSVGDCLEPILEDNYSMCHEADECEGSTPGCPLTATFGEATWTTSVADETRTTTLVIPVVDGGMLGALDALGSDCVMDVAFAASEPPTITVTITSSAAAMCNETEEVLSVDATADASSMVISVTAGEGTTTNCETVHTALQTAPYRDPFVEAVESDLVAALGADSFVGRDCRICGAGTCSGLVCTPE